MLIWHLQIVLKDFFRSEHEICSQNFLGAYRGMAALFTGSSGNCTKEDYML